MSEKILLIGIKHYIKLKKKRILELTDPKQEWNQDSKGLPTYVVRLTVENIHQEIEYFETILKASKIYDAKRAKKSL